jgi:cytochrome P450
MNKFVDLPVSIFDSAFSLDPYNFIEPLYREEDILGFTSEGMKFLFRFEDCRDLISAHTHVSREPVATEETEKQFQEFAQRYPTRAWHFKHMLADIKHKALLNNYLARLLDNIPLQDIEPAFAGLSEKGRHDHYLTAVQLLPMRMLLAAWGFVFDNEKLLELYDNSVALVKSYDNYDNETLLAEGEAGMARNVEYVTEQVNRAAPGSLLYDFVKESCGAGIEEDFTIADLVTFIQGTPNTLSMSTALMIRNILRYPESIVPLRENPSLINDDIVMEFLRRDNHVKALARQVHEPFSLRDYELEVGESFYIFYPGINLDPTHWDDPLALNFNRVFTNSNHNIFGGARYACVGRRIALKYFSELLPGLLRYLPCDARVVQDEVTLDGGWVTERVITKLPIVVP